MSKFRGKIGFFTGELIESSPGVYREEINERYYRGDVTKVSRRVAKEGIHGDISVNHQISIVGDAYALGMFYNIRYVEWQGVKWLVNTIEVSRPRIILYIGSEFERE